MWLRATEIVPAGPRNVLRGRHTTRNIEARHDGVAAISKASNFSPNGLSELQMPSKGLLGPSHLVAEGARKLHMKISRFLNFGDSVAHRPQRGEAGRRDQSESSAAFFHSREAITQRGELLLSVVVGGDQALELVSQVLASILDVVDVAVGHVAVEVDLTSKSAFAIFK